MLGLRGGTEDCTSADTVSRVDSPEPLLELRRQGWDRDFRGTVATYTALTHLDLSDTEIGREGGERFVRVLCKCTTLSLLDLSCNGISDVGKGRFRVS